MPSNQIIKYVWLVDTIYRAGRITFRDINSRWLDSDLSGGVELSKRTFHKWRNAVEEMFGLIIDNENGGDYRYYISNEKEVRGSGLRSWIINTMSVGNLLAGNLAMNDRILLEDIPSGYRHLADIVEAVRLCRQIVVDYKSFRRDEPSRFTVEPYCVKLFNRRWYVVAHSPGYDGARIYALDRILSLTVTATSFTVPRDFSPEAFFYGCYGIIPDERVAVECVRLRTSRTQAEYLRSLPLHASQREILDADAPGVFEYTLRPTYDFIQKILSFGNEVEVLAPQSLRRTVALRIAAMQSLYADVPLAPEGDE